MGCSRHGADPIEARKLAVLSAVLDHCRSLDAGRGFLADDGTATDTGLRYLAVRAEGYWSGAASHCQRVGRLSAALGRCLGWAGWMAEALGRAAELHDIGKLGVSSTLLRARRKLTAQEWARVERHTTLGHEILRGLPGEAMASSIAASHHETFDGKGYPRGLKGVEIPVESRVVKVVDVYDTLRDERVWKRALTHPEALQVLQKGDDRAQASHFDPLVLEAFLDCHGVMAATFEAWS